VFPDTEQGRLIAGEERIASSDMDHNSRLNLQGDESALSNSLKFPAENSIAS
jgi:hypothetical protein